MSMDTHIYSSMIKQPGLGSRASGQVAQASLRPRSIRHRSRRWSWDLDRGAIPIDIFMK